MYTIHNNPSCPRVLPWICHVNTKYHDDTWSTVLCVTSNFLGTKRRQGLSPSTPKYDSISCVVVVVFFPRVKIPHFIPFSFMLTVSSLFPSPACYSVSSDLAQSSAPFQPSDWRGTGVRTVIWMVSETAMTKSPSSYKRKRNLCINHTNLNYGSQE